MKRILSLLLAVTILSSMAMIPLGVSAAKAVNMTVSEYATIRGGNLNAYCPALKHKEVFGIGGKASDDSSIAITNIGNQVDVNGASVANTNDRTKGIPISDLGYPYVQLSPSDMATRDDYIVLSFNIYFDNARPFSNIAFTTNSGTTVGPKIPSNQLIRDQWNKITYVFKMNTGNNSVVKIYINGRMYTSYNSTDKVYVTSWSTVLGKSGKTVVRVGAEFANKMNYIWNEGAPAWDAKDESGEWLLKTNVSNYVSGPKFDDATGIVYMDDFVLYSADVEPVVEDTAACITAGPVEKNEHDISNVYNKITVLEGSKLSDFTFANASDATIKLYKDATLAEEITDENHILAIGNTIVTQRATDYRKYFVEAVSDGIIAFEDGSKDIGSNSMVTSSIYEDPYAGNVYKQTYNITSGSNTYLKDYAWMNSTSLADGATYKEKAFMVSKKWYDRFVHISFNFNIPKNAAFTKMFVGSNGHGPVGKSSTDDIAPANADGKWHHIDIIVNRAKNTSETYIDGVKTGTNNNSSLGKFGYNGRGMFTGVRIVAYGAANTPFDVYLDDISIVDKMSASPMEQTFSGVSVKGSVMSVLVGTKVGDIKAANPAADIKIYDENGIVADDADAAVEGYQAFVKTEDGASRTYDIKPWDGITVISESTDGLASNISGVRVSTQVLTGGFGGESDDNKYFKLTRTFNAKDDYTGMDANMYLVAPDAKQNNPMSKYYVIETNVWNDDDDTLSINIGTNGNNGASFAASKALLKTNAWNKYVNVVEYADNADGRKTYTTYLNGVKIGEGNCSKGFITTNKAVRIIILSTANLTKQGDSKPNYSDKNNSIYMDNLRVYESVNYPDVEGYTNEAVNTSSVYAPEATDVIVANGNASDVCAAVSAATGAEATVYSNYTVKEGGIVNNGSVVEGDVVITKKNEIYKLYKAEVVDANSVKFVEFKDGIKAVANVTDNGKLILASYATGDEMVDVNYTDAVSGWNVFDSVEKEGASYLNAMLVNNFNELKPLSANDTLSLK